VRHRLAPGAQAYLVLATGAVRVNGDVVGAGDGVAIAGLPEVVIAAIADAELVLVEVQ